jgi:homoserine O-acetyltransferase
MADTAERDFSTFALGDVRLERGGTLPNAVLAYATYGEPNAAGDNCVLLPTYYTGTHRSYTCLIGPGRALDPTRWFIVIPNLFGNGVSTSPSHGTTPGERAAFPHVTIGDNVACQRRLLEHLGVRRIALVAGWSLGAIQTYAWAATHPDLVDAFLPYCGAARCWPMNAVFLEGVRAALCADAAFAGGAYVRPPTAGLRAFGRVYAGWAYSAAFFRERLYRDLGYEDLEAFLTAWEDEHLAWDANDLLAMLWTWRHADLDADALRRIRARGIVMPCDQDAYFTLAENTLEAAFVPNATLRAFRSPYGHCAGAPGRFPRETRFLEDAMRELLAPRTR